MAAAAFITSKLKSTHHIQLVHLWNVVMGIILFGLNIGVAVKIRSFISNGSEMAGFGNYNVFAYPATYVYMLIPSICSLVYSIILALDPSPSYPAWRPSKTFLSSVALLAGALFFASLFPVLPGADMITRPDSAMACTWADFMEWRTIYNNVDIYPWVGNMDAACQTLHAADAFCWIITIGWFVLLGLYLRRMRQLRSSTEATHNASDVKTYNQHQQPSSTASPSWPMEEIKTTTDTKTEVQS
ncbi:hypothetical protein BDB00DRAFT_793396 [Zychaea mexicana]|uniref:uncharacterized protein n=1 Tax=Zychaea mexicana TaxID=64656 RepID=UPI0022FEDF07|nr:uncharacterized protein BDB00DRAFT_793396 [Zychaea mexicana]KAI9474875.1 hypothetical protein BDB00DRAFT_793396 [Zychaea mexicana]